VRLAALALLAATCTGQAAPPPDPPIPPPSDPAGCAAACAKAQAACPFPKQIDPCVATCQQAGPDLEGSLYDLAVNLTCH
jgi:hypothetical protein